MAKWFNIFRRAEHTDINLVHHEVAEFKEEVEVKGLTALSKRAMVDYSPVGFTVAPGKRNLLKAYQMTSDWQLYRMEKYYEYESIVYNIVNKYIQLVLKNGYDWVLDEEFQDKVKERKEFIKVFEILLRAGVKRYMPQEFLSIYAKDFFLYGNVFIRKAYSPGKEKSEPLLNNIWFGDPLKFNVIIDKDTEEVVKYVHDPKLRRRGDFTRGYTPSKPTNYMERYGGMIPMSFKFGYFGILDEKLDPEEVLHIRYEKLHQAIFSMPPLYPVLDDIVALRSIEEDIQLLSFQYGHPLLHATIAREGLSDMEIESESSFMRGQLEKMEGNGLIITSDRVGITLKAAMGQMPELTKFHTLFLSRIERGSGMPGIFTGSSDKTGGGRQTSETMEASTYGTIRHLARSLSEGIQPLIDEIWYTLITKEKKFYDPSLPSCPLKLKFSDTDDNETRAKEQHSLQLWNSGAITHGEFRSSVGKKADPVHEKKYYHDIQGEVNAAAEAAKANSISNPSNQHGKKTKAGSRKDNEELIDE